MPSYSRTTHIPCCVRTLMTNISKIRSVQGCKSSQRSRTRSSMTTWRAHAAKSWRKRSLQGSTWSQLKSSFLTTKWHATISSLNATCRWIDQRAKSSRSCSTTAQGKNCHRSRTSMSSISHGSKLKTRYIKLHLTTSLCHLQCQSWKRTWWMSHHQVVKQWRQRATRPWGMLLVAIKIEQHHDSPCLVQFKSTMTTASQHCHKQTKTLASLGWPTWQRINSTLDRWNAKNSNFATRLTDRFPRARLALCPSCGVICKM